MTKRKTQSPPDTTGPRATPSDKARAEATSIELEEILTLLPHRFPFLLIDRIEEMEGEQRGVGIKKVTENEFWIPGHFPDWPVMPGVLIVEGIAQTTAALVSYHHREDIDCKVIYFMSVDHCRFRHPVVPGDELRMEVTQIKRRGDVWRYKGIARVDGKCVAETELTAMNYRPDAAETEARQKKIGQKKS